jgi:membrane protein implicated in regulation of membrane protease activity
MRVHGQPARLGRTDALLIVLVAVIVGLALAWLLPAFDGTASAIVIGAVSVIVVVLLARRRERAGHL